MLSNIPVLGLYGGERDGCSFYRMYSPFRFLKESGYVYDWQALKATNQEEELEEDVAGWELDTVQESQNYRILRLKQLILTSDSPNALPGQESLDSYVEEIHSKNAIVGCDFDDDLLSIPPHNPAYDKLGDDFAERFHRQVRQMDFFTVTTDFLAERLIETAGLDPNRVWVVPNLIDFSSYELEKWYRVTPPNWLPEVEAEFDEDGTVSMRKVRKTRLSHEPERPVVIGLQGGHNHYRDWQLIAGALSRIVERYGNRVRLLVAGYHPDYLKEALEPATRRGLVWWKSWTNFDQHPATVMNFDINLCPLDNDLFSLSKSPLKWLEGSAAGAASIVSPTVYGGYVTHGINALVAESPEEWEEALEYLLDNPDHRRLLARNAHLYARTGYNLQLHAFEWVNAHQEAWHALKG